MPSATSSVQDCYAYLLRTNWHRAALFLFVVVIAVGYGVGFSVASQAAQSRSDDDYSRRLNLFSDWQMTVTSHFARAGSLAASIAAYASSYATVPANLSAPAMDRVVINNDEAYWRLCAGLFRQVPGITTLEVQSGGVIAQIYPIGYFPIGFDVIGLPEDQGYEELLRTGQAITAGPAKIFTEQYGIFIRYPVYVSNRTTPDQFWGTGNVVMLIDDMLQAMNISTLFTEHQMDYVFWYTSEKLRTLDVLYTSAFDVTIGLEGGPIGAQTARVMAEGMRMRLPIAEPGKTAYLALYPRDGPVSSDIAKSDLVMIILIVLVGAFVLVAAQYLSLLAAFWLRHRYAPSVSGTASDASSTGIVSPTTAAAGKNKANKNKGDNNNKVFVAAITLRGAQPITELAPLESVKLFAQFFAQVRRMCYSHKCYPICEIGDRTMYVASSDPKKLAKFARKVVSEVTIQPNISAHGGGPSHAPYFQTMSGGAAASTRPANFQQIHRTATTNTTNAHYRGTDTTTTMSSSQVHRTLSPTTSSLAHPAQSMHSVSICNTSASAFSSGPSAGHLNSIRCIPSVGMHAVASMPRTYDPIRDKYFFGNTNQLAKLGAAADNATAGEIAWSAAFNAAFDITAEHAFDAPDGDDSNSSTSNQGDKKKTLQQVPPAHLMKSTAAVANFNPNKDHSQPHHRRTSQSSRRASIDNSNNNLGTSCNNSTHTSASRRSTMSKPRKVDENGKRAVATAVGGATEKKGFFVVRLRKSNGDFLDEVDDDDEDTQSEKDDDEEEEDEESADLSVAMAIISDPYVRRMAVTAGDQQTAELRKNRLKESKADGKLNSPTSGGGGGGHNNNNTNQKGEKSGGRDGGGGGVSHTVTSITRTATVLQIAFCGEAQQCIKIIRKAVADEKGAVVSAYSSLVIATFNLLTPGGNHQTRAADVVSRLRVEFEEINVQFVCSIHAGRVNALIGSDGMVMCVGDALTIGNDLLQRAIALTGIVPSGSGPYVAPRGEKADGGGKDNNNNNNNDKNNMSLAARRVKQLALKQSLLVDASKIRFLPLMPPTAVRRKKMSSVSKGGGGGGGGGGGIAAPPTTAIIVPRASSGVQLNENADPANNTTTTANNNNNNGNSLRSPTTQQQPFAPIFGASTRQQNTSDSVINTNNPMSGSGSHLRPEAFALSSGGGGEDEEERLATEMELVHGLCLCYCYNDLSSVYELEAIDVMTTAPLAIGNMHTPPHQMTGNTNSASLNHLNINTNNNNALAMSTSHDNVLPFSATHHNAMMPASSDDEAVRRTSSTNSAPRASINPQHHHVVPPPPLNVHTHTHAGGHHHLRVAAMPAARVLYRLVAPRERYDDGQTNVSGGNRHEDEWMYQLRDGESRSVFNEGNMIFKRIAARDFSDFESGKIRVNANGVLVSTPPNDKEKDKANSGDDPLTVGHANTGSHPTCLLRRMSRIAIASLSRFVVVSNSDATN